MDRNARRQWRRVVRTFFAPAPSPTRGETEAFVSRVMERIEEADPAPLWGLSWLSPALSLAITLLFASILWPRPQAYDFSEGGAVSEGAEADPGIGSALFDSSSPSELL